MRGVARGVLNKLFKKVQFKNKIVNNIITSLRIKCKQTHMRAIKLKKKRRIYIYNLTHFFHDLQVNFLNRKYLRIQQYATGGEPNQRRV